MRKKIKNLTIKLSVGLFIVAYLFFFSVPSAVAFDWVGLDDISGGVVDDIMDDALDYLGVDQTELRTNVELMNSSRYKKSHPQVSLNFVPANPVEGEKVTVTATPIYFMNGIEDLYFTWYLKSNGCDETDDPSKEEKARCDLDGDGEIDIDDYKIKAMRIIANDDFAWGNANYDDSSDNDEYLAVFGGDDQRDKNAYCYVHDVRSGEEYKINCDEHLFPNSPSDETGDKKFGASEESFWRTDPNSDDTAHTGNVDEANVAGLGINSFTWNFEEGDKVGVVVEGVSVEPSTEKSGSSYNSSYKTMWAMPDGCDPDNINISGIDDVSDLNECLYDNLFSPAENGPQSDKLEVSLSYSPSSPINDEGSYEDSSLSSGDDLIIYSSILDTENTNFVKYQWEVFQSDEANPESWGNPISKNNIPGATQMTGLGLNTFKFKLNFANPKKYLKVKLTATENVRENLLREGHSDVVIPISSVDSEISVFPVDVSDSLKLSLGDNEICQSGSDKSICKVSKNQIIGVSVPGGNLTDFSWTIDGKPLSYQECFFEECEDDEQFDEQTNVAYFPVLKENGEQYTVNLTATDEKRGDKMNLTRIFEVSDPQIIISSVDEEVCKPVLLGHYIDMDGKEWPDYSKINFWGLSGYKMKLKTSTSGFSVLPEDLIWTVNGESVSVYGISSQGFSVDSDGILTLPVKDAGEKYNVSVSAIYSQNDLVKKALKKYWGVSYGDFYEKVIGHNIAITIQEFSPGYADSEKEKVFASVFSSMPSYLGFLLKIVITGFLMIFISRLFMSFSPDFKKRY